MKKSELEKAANEHSDRFDQLSDTDYIDLDMKRGFEAGAKWALEWARANIKCATVYKPAPREYLLKLLRIEEDEKR